MAWTEWKSMGTKGTLLWENLNTSERFGNKTIKVPTDGVVYKSALIKFYGNIDHDGEIIAYFDHTHCDNMPYFEGGFRQVTVFLDDSNDSITMICDHDNNDDTTIIPYQILAFKEQLFDDCY